MSGVIADPPHEIAIRQQACESDAQDRLWAEDFAARLTGEGLYIELGTLNWANPDTTSYQLPNFYAVVMTVQERDDYAGTLHSSKADQGMPRPLGWSVSSRLPSYSEGHTNRQRASKQAEELFRQQTAQPEQ